MRRTRLSIGYSIDLGFEPFSRFRTEAMRSLSRRALTPAAKSSLAGSLAAYVRQNEIFTRVAPNTYGLSELGHDVLELTGEMEEPPEGFGRAPVGVDEEETEDVPF